MNLFKDIAEIIKDDKEHHLKITVNDYEVSVYLIYDPLLDFDENVIIPITYDTIEKFAYIPNDEYRKLFNVTDYGIDIKEIKLIYDIMNYLENHEDEICELCDQYNLEGRVAL